MLSEGVDRREAIPIVPKASHDTGYTHDKGGHATVKCYSGLWPCGWRGYAMCNFLRTYEITFLYLKLASCENKLLILTSGKLATQNTPS